MMFFGCGSQEPPAKPAAPAVTTPAQPAAPPTPPPAVAPPEAPKPAASAVSTATKPEAPPVAAKPAPAPAAPKPAAVTPPAAPVKPAATAKLPAVADTLVLPASQGNVTMPHLAHAKMFPCATCHGEAAPGELGLPKETAHALCRDCHKAKGAGPTACGDCHKK
jgi:predicted CXXCH cytochrome family protein